MRILAADHKNDTGSRERERERERGRREGTERGDRARERQSQVENERWWGETETKRGRVNRQTGEGGGGNRAGRRSRERCREGEAWMEGKSETDFETE